MKKTSFIILSMICLLFFATVQKADALVFKPIEWAATGVSKVGYFGTKYSLKAAVWTVKKTAKGVWLVTKKSWNAATKHESGATPTKAPKYYMNNDESLPPVPDANNLPEIRY